MLTRRRARTQGQVTTLFWPQGNSEDWSVEKGDERGFLNAEFAVPLGHLGGEI